MSDGTLQGGPRPWAARWSQLLDAAGASAARRVQRGQALARRGAVEDLRLEPGAVRATVAEDRWSPELVELTWSVPSEREWEDAVATLRSELRFTAALLDGELPPDLVETLERSGIALVPRLDDLELRCGCADRAPVCRHVAAVHAAVGTMVERDPTVLLRLRGRSRAELLQDLRRGEEGAAAPPPVDLSRGLFAAHGDLEAIALHPTPVDDPAGLLGHLGDPPGVDDPEPFARIMERAAAGAWRLAAGDGSQAADQQLLLAELRAQRTASAASLAEALGRDPDQVRDELDELFADGTVMRTGSGDRARYRAAST